MGMKWSISREAFDTNWVAPPWKNVDEFENELAAYVGSKHAKHIKRRDGKDCILQSSWQE